MENKLIGAGDLIESSWLIYKNNWKPLLKVSFWMFLPTALVTATGLLMRLLATSELVAVSVAMIVSIPVYLAQFIATIVFVLAIDARLENKNIDIKKMTEGALKRFFPIIFVVIIATAAIFGGFLLLIIPGVIFSVWFAFAFYESVLADARGTSALKASRDLARGKWLQIFWRLIATTIFWSVTVWLLMSAIFLIFGALSQPWKTLIGSEPGASYAAAFLDILSNAVQAVVAPIFVAIGVILYRSLKTSKN